MTDYAQEQEMEIEALQAILMEDFQEEDDNSPVPSGLPADAKRYQITISPRGDGDDEPTEFPVRLGLFFAHTPTYPDEPPLLSVKSLQGVKQTDVEEIKAQLDEEAAANLGMAMIYTLATSAKEWLISKYGSAQNQEEEGDEEEEEVIEAHGLPVTEETFTDWRERFEAEQALEQAKLLSDAGLTMKKEKKMTGRQWFVQRASKGIAVEEEEDGEVAEEDADEDIEFEENFEDDDEDIEEDMLEHYLAEKEKP